MKNIILKNRVEKLLEAKNNDYKKKYFILSTLSQTNSFKSKRIMTEIYSFCETLNKTNGELPDSSFLYQYHKDVLAYSNLSIREINKKSKNLKEYIELNYQSNDNDSLINEELNKIVTSKDKKINKKLLETLFIGVEKRIPILLENKYIASIFGLNESQEDKMDIIDMADLFDKDKPSKYDLRRIDRESQEENAEEKVYIDEKADDVVAFFGGKDPRKFTSKDLKKIGYESDPNYYARLNKLKAKSASMSAEEKAEFESLKKKIKGSPVYTAWDKLGLDAINKIQSSSINVQRKFFIIEAIYYIITIQKGTLQFLGLTDAEKSRHLSGSQDDEIIKSFMTGKLKSHQKDELSSDMSTSHEIKKFMNQPKIRRRSSHMLTQEEIRYFDNSLQSLLLQGDYDLENEAISENKLLKLMREIVGSDAKYQEFKESFDVMFNDQKPYHYYVEKLSKEEHEELDRENIEFDERSEREARESWGSDIDSETGEPLYADFEDIERIKSEKETIDIASAVERIADMPIVTMTNLDYKEYMEEMKGYLNRLSELNKKLVSEKPDIFEPFSTDVKGNLILDDLGDIEEIPAEGLTDEEILEYESLIEKVSQGKKITILGLDRRADIYDEMYERGATPEEYMSFMKSFNLLDDDKPKKYRDIARSSYGEFRDTAGARQYGLKAWFKGNYYSLSSKERAQIYAQLAEKWFERLITLDLIHDEEIKRPGDKPMPKLAKYFDKLARFMSPKKLEKYFETGDDSDSQAIKEKINAAISYSESIEEFKSIISQLQSKDPQFEQYAVLDSMFTGTSGFRIYSTTMLKEFYNDYVWSSIEEDLTFAVKDYFNTNYPSGRNIGRSLQRADIKNGIKGVKLKDIPKSEGKDLFNPIIYLAMSRVGLQSEDAFKQEGSEDSESYQRDYFLGNINNKGNFALKVNKFNSANPNNQLTSKDGSPFSAKDVEMLLDDIFSSNGIIGKVKERIRLITSDVTQEFITFLFDYNEGKIDQIMINSLAMSNVLKRGADPLNKEIFKEIGKDTSEAFRKYKNEFASQLTSESFEEYLSDMYGYETVNIASLGSKNATTKHSL